MVLRDDHILILAIIKLFAGDGLLVVGDGPPESQARRSTVLYLSSSLRV